jgi:8-oxo-dGTP pyrophosphatase MutT (NUDIX family)
VDLVLVVVGRVPETMAAMDTVTAVATTTERFRAAVAVYGILIEDARVLLMRRAGSGYHDGELSLPAGHLDDGEDVLTALVRELHEELDIVVQRGACRLALVGHRVPEEPGDDYLDLIFWVDAWRGTPVIAEPDQCTELTWADPAALPDDVIPYIADALAAAHNGTTLLTSGWDTQ